MTAIPPGPSEPTLAALARRLDELEIRVRELERGRSEFRRALNRLGDALSSTHDRPKMLAAVVETCALYVGASAAVFYGIVAGSARLRPLAAAGTADASSLVELALGEGIAGVAAGSGAVAVWPGAGAGVREGAGDGVGVGDGVGEGVGAVTISPAEPAAARAAVAVPVHTSGRLFGVVALYDRDDRSDAAFSTDEVEALATLVRQVEPAIENTFLYEEAARLAITDGLTSLWNRRQFDLTLASEHQRAARFGEPFSVVILDIDHFKLVNDRHGHQAGDSVLIEVAQRLAGGVRNVDVVARVGGEEFGLILPNTGPAGAVSLAEKLRATIAAQPFDLKEGPPVAMTASLGVASYPDHAGNWPALVRAADAALYRAKELGRDRVESAMVAG